jgi:DNA-binding Xre family transcriptional regulator
MPRVDLKHSVLPAAPAKRPTGKTFLQVMPRRIVKYRELRAVTQGALAKAAHIARSTLNLIESGQARDMKVSTLERICHALDVSGDALLGYNSVKLVRKPHLLGVQPDGPESHAVARACAICGAHIAARALHLPGDCMLELSDAGGTAARIGAVFGLSTRAIELVLREEHAARRHRKF